MDLGTREQLDGLNREFYERHAVAFDATRDHPWPGWERVVERIPRGAPSLLDAGCGNGRFARYLVDRGRSDVRYTGVDTSRALLAVARERGAPKGFHFQHGDVRLQGGLPAGRFDVIVLFGVLHHIPGFDQRVELLARLARRLSDDGFLAATLWRFGSDPRVRGRTVPKESLPSGIDPQRLEPGDQLLRWGEGDEVVRYCHFVDAEEIGRLLEATRAAGLGELLRFRSDGRSGELNEYLLWSRDRG